MIHFRDGFEYQGLYCFPAGDEPFSYHFLPPQPSPELDSMGRPTLMNVPAGKGGFLQLGVHLMPVDSAVEALRQELVRRNAPGEPPPPIKLAMAPLKVEIVTLMLGDGSGGFEDLATNPSSGFPPYAAIFSLSLDARQQNSVSAALNGRGDFLQVHYSLHLETPVKVTSTLRGDLRSTLVKMPVFPEQPSPISGDTLLATLLDQAIESGELSIETQVSESAPDSLVSQARQLVIEQTINLLKQFHQGEKPLPDASQAEISATLKDRVTLPLNMQTDVSTWFTSGAGSGHIMIHPSSHT